MTTCHQLHGIAQKTGVTLEDVLHHCKSLEVDLFFKVPEHLTVFVIDSRRHPSGDAQINHTLNSSYSPAEPRPEIHFLSITRATLASLTSQTELHASSSHLGLADNGKLTTPSWRHKFEDLIAYELTGYYKAIPIFGLLPSQLTHKVSWKGSLDLRNEHRPESISVEAKHLHITNEAFEKIKSRIAQVPERKTFKMERREGVFSEKLYHMHVVFETLWTNVRGSRLPRQIEWRTNAKNKLKEFLSVTDASVMACLICPSDAEYTAAQSTDKKPGSGFPTDAFMALHDTALKYWDTNPYAKIKKEDLIEALSEKGLKSNWAKCGAVVINVSPRPGRPIKPSSSLSASHFLRHRPK